MRSVHLNGWQRIGIILSVLWVLVGAWLAQQSVYAPVRAGYSKCISLGVAPNICKAGMHAGIARKTKEALSGAIAVFALAPIALGWVFIWIVRSVGRGFGFSRARSQNFSRTSDFQMTEQLKTTPACKLNISDEQYRAVGHVALQWAFLEGEIDREIVWLNKQNTDSQSMKAPFDARVGGWQRLAADIYAGHSELLEAVVSISAQALAIKRERDKLVHCNLVSSGMVIRTRGGQVLEISDAGTPAHLEDLACRISDITAQLFQHYARLARVFENPL